MKKLLAFMLVVILVLLTGCTAKKPKQAIRLTVWHVYGGQTDSPLNDLIDRFNNTVGKEQGIQVVVTSVTNTNTVHESVLASANDDPGAPKLPDLFISYPKTVAALPDPSILVDYSDYFSEQELSAFIPAFIEEGTMDGRLVVLPVAKSTEIMFVNKTLFDRFAEETGVTLDDLSTWEGLYAAAVEYARWTEEKTGAPKAFFTHDYPFNYYQVGVESLGEEFFAGDTLSLSPAYRTVWDPVAKASLEGGVYLADGYATDPLRVGDAIVSVASSASVLYYKDEVTYANNTSEPVEYIALPCPVFENGATMVMQRGAGFCTVKSTPEREKAACTFLKWLTEPKVNTEFVTATGYMPVTQEAFDKHLQPALETLSDPKYRSLYEAFISLQENGYEFYTPPQLPSYLEKEDRLEYQYRLILTLLRDRYVQTGMDESQKDALIDMAYNEFIQSIQ